MNRDRLISLIAAGAEDASGQSADCPDEMLVAGYVDGGLDDALRQQFERHLADCDRCLALVGLLCRERGAEATEPVADGVRLRALALVEREADVGRKFRIPRWQVPQWAVAAMLVLVVPLLLIGREPDRGVTGHGRPEPSLTRSFDTGDPELEVLSPLAGATLDPRVSSFEWRDVAGTPYYDVRVVTDDGEVVAEQRVAESSWRLPPGLTLQPGAEYYLHVDAYPSGDRALSSDHVPFRVPDARP